MRVGTEDFNTLKELRMVYPNHTISPTKINTKQGKQTHNGLTFDFMKRYANARTDYKNGVTEFEAVKEMYKGKPSRVKSWFLENFPEYANSVEFAEHIAKNAA